MAERTHSKSRQHQVRIKQDPPHDQNNQSTMVFTPSSPLVVFLFISALAVQKAVALTGTRRNVTIPAKNLTLEGTLRIPSSDNPNATSPGVVLIHGSGTLSRDSPLFGQLGMTFGFEIPVFSEIGDALQERGIAVLTYDKRTCGSFNNCTNDNSYPLPDIDALTINTFMDDALAAAMFLQDQDEVESVTILGHSQSGPFIPILLQQEPSLAGGIMVAGNYMPIEELLEYQLNFTLDLYEQLGVNTTTALALPQVIATVELVNGVNSILNGTYDEPYFAGATTEFWRSWSELTDRALAVRDIDQPILIFNGELDTNVPSSEALRWYDHFEELNITKRIEIPPCVTHALNCLLESDYTQITANDIGTIVAPATIDAISNFIFAYVVGENLMSTSGANDSWPRSTVKLIGLWSVVTMFVVV